MLEQQCTKGELDVANATQAVQPQERVAILREHSLEGKPISEVCERHGLVRKLRPAPPGRPGEERAVQRREERQIRSSEAEYVGALWHLVSTTARGSVRDPLPVSQLDEKCYLEVFQTARPRPAAKKKARV